MAKITWDDEEDVKPAALPKSRITWDNQATSGKSKSSNFNKSISDPKLSINPAKGANFMSALKAGVPLNQEDAIKSFAASRGISPSRYTVIDNKIAYRADDNKYYPEVPSVTQRPLTALGYYAPDILEAIPDIGVGIATAPLSPAVSIPATAATASASNAARQGISNLLTGSSFELFPTAMSGIFSGLGQAAPSIARGIRERRTAQDIGKLSQGTNALDIANLMRNSRRFGISLTPAEMTNLPSLKSQQKILGNVPESADDLNDYYLKRYGKVQTAVNDMLAKISPTGEAIEAGSKGQKALLQAEQNLIDQRKAASEPIYQAAFASSVPVDSRPVIAQIDQMLTIAKGDEKKALLKLKSNLYREKDALDAQGNPVKITTAEDRLSALQRAKFDLDADLRSDAVTSMDATIQKDLLKLKESLLQQMGKDNPEYLAANAKFEELSAPLNEFRERKTGLSLTKMSPDNLNQFASRLFQGADPATIKYARQKIESVDPNAWKAVTRSYLQDTWEKASKVNAGAQDVKIDAGATWNNLLFGDPKVKKSLQAALSRQEYQALTDLADVLQAAGRVKKLGSDTAFNQLVMEELVKNPPITGIASGSARAVGTMLSPLDWGKAIGDWGRKKDASVNAKEYVDIITSPNAMKKLRQLRQMSPTSAKFIAGLSQLGMQYGIIGQSPASEESLQKLQEGQ